MKTYTLITKADNIDGCNYYTFKGSFKQARLKVKEYATKKHNFYNVEVFYWVTEWVNENERQLLTGSII